MPVQEDDILILASDGLSDNLWDTDILDEVVRFRRSFMGPAPDVAPAAPAVSANANASANTNANATAAHTPSPSATFRRSTLAGMLSEALCSRAKRVSEMRGMSKAAAAAEAKKSVLTSAEDGVSQAQAQAGPEVPFAKRAKEQGKVFEGGKPDGEFVYDVFRSMDR